MEQLETAQLSVARAITKLVSTTPRAVVWKEADLPPLAQRLRELTLLRADKWLVQAAATLLNADRCLEVQRVPGHCGLMGNELANEEPKSGSAEH